jgi:aminoglycoside phosphotransferase family enzyme
MSWVFLAAGRVYKLKKPVRSPVLDFSTLTAREADCRAEVRLNRRLAPDVYLGVTRLTLEPGGDMAVDGEGAVIDWLVKMRRLPEASMLDRAIERGTVERDQIESLAGLLSDFYLSLSPAPVDPEQHLDLFRRQHQENRRLLERPDFGLDGELLRQALGAVQHVLDNEADMIRARAAEGRIKEGHGDLRPEHICLEEPPAIIDCLEFNRALRLLDPFDELAGLAVECRHLGAEWIGVQVIDRCRKALGSSPGQHLMDFYTAYRATLRARLLMSHLLDPEVREPERWPPLARAYLQIAAGAGVSLRPPAAPPANRPGGSAG